MAEEYEPNGFLTVVLTPMRSPLCMITSVRFSHLNCVPSEAILVHRGGGSGDRLNVGPNELGEFMTPMQGISASNSGNVCSSSYSDADGSTTTFMADDYAALPCKFKRVGPSYYGAVAKTLRGQDISMVVKCSLARNGKLERKG